jgi:hypothetical protein
MKLPKHCYRAKGFTGVLLEYDLKINYGRLRAKLMVFKNRSSLKASWKRISNQPLSRGCCGVVNPLSTYVEDYSAGRLRHRIEGDPGYFCVIGLVHGFLTMEIICHESVHAGFCFAKRRLRSHWDDRAEEFDEEAVCYPAGKIARLINKCLDASGLYQ